MSPSQAGEAQRFDEVAAWAGKLRTGQAADSARSAVADALMTIRDRLAQLPDPNPYRGQALCKLGDLAALAFIAENMTIPTRPPEP